MMRITSSSTSSSEPGASGGAAPAGGAPVGGARVWRRFTVTFAVAVTVSLAALTAGLVALDPYDTGWLTPLGPAGMAEGPPWVVNASRARDPRFDAAVIGNSRVQMLEPGRLDAGAGDRFVNLGIQGAGPPELQLVLKTFLRHRAAPRALVIGVDEWWCRAKQERGATFPYWLYATDVLDYLRGLMRYQSLEYVQRRVAVLRGTTPLARADGYWDYTPVYMSMTGAEAAQDRMRAAGGRPQASENPENEFPAAVMLKSMLGAIPAATRVILVWPPTHMSYQPTPGSAAEDTLRRCKAALHGIVDGRENSAFVDWGGDRDINHEPRNFHDETHYIKAMAGPLSDAVAAALAGPHGTAAETPETARRE